MTIQYLYLKASDNLELLREAFDIMIAESPEVKKYGADIEAATKLITDEKRTFVIGALKAGRLLGVIIVSSASLWFNPKYRIAQDLLVWVHPEHRNSFIFIEMLERAEHVAKRAGIQSLKLGQLTGIDPERTARLYKSLGYRTIGFSSIKEL